MFFFKKWAIPGLFFIYFRLFKQHYNFTANKCEKCPSSKRLEPTTFGTRVSQHNHYIRAPSLSLIYILINGNLFIHFLQIGSINWSFYSVQLQPLLLHSLDRTACACIVLSTEAKRVQHLNKRLFICCN